jgi:hypothetical protein
MRPQLALPPAFRSSNGGCPDGDNVVKVHDVSSAKEVGLGFAGCCRLPLPVVAENQPDSAKQNRMTIDQQFSGFIARMKQRIAALGSQPGTTMTDDEFNALALELFQLQFQHVVPYRRLCEARGVSPDTVRHWEDIPAVPTTAFKELELTSLPPEDRPTVFHSSGTTADKPSRHFHNAQSLSLYETSLLGWFQQHVFGDWNQMAEEERIGPLDKPGMLMLTPPPPLVPHSSLVHMFETTRRELGARDSVFTGRIDHDGAWELDIEATLFALRKSMCANRPLTILGTAFSFVHLLDHFAANNIRYRLAEGSRVLETGGYKGRSRELPKAELHALITKHLGIPAERIVVEYGMSELGSQAYSGEGNRCRMPDAGCRNVSSFVIRPLSFPPWTRVRFISPESGGDAAEGQPGLIRIYDLANVSSVLGVQTEDLGIRHGDGFELLGRAVAAEPRGCSLMTA